jgi:hypothetical protein
MGFPLTTIPSK